MSLAGEYKSSTTTAHPLEGTTWHLPPAHLPNRAHHPPKPALSSSVKNAFSSIWLWIFLLLETGVPFIWTIFVLLHADGLTNSPGVQCTGFKPGPTAWSSLWPNMRNDSKAHGNGWGLCSLVQQQQGFVSFASKTQLSSQWSSVWLEVRSIRLLAKSLD